MTFRMTAIALAACLAACSSAERGAAGLPALDAARLSSPEARARGRALYRNHCTLCHGDAGDGRGLRNLGLARPPRDFTDPAWRRAVTPDQVFARIRDGVPGTAMPAWRILGDEGVGDLTAYVLSLGS